MYVEMRAHIAVIVPVDDQRHSTQRGVRSKDMDNCEAPIALLSCGPTCLLIHICESYYQSDCLSFFFSSRRRHTRFDCDWSSDVFFFSSRRRHTRFDCDWSSDVCSSDLGWTLAYQMGVRFDRPLEGFDGPFEKIRGFATPPPGTLARAEGDRKSVV